MFVALGFCDCAVIQRSLNRAENCRCRWPGKKSNSRRKPSVKFQLLTPNQNLELWLLIYYQQHLDGQAGPSLQMTDITLPDTTTFVALALQMGHELKDTLHDYWSRLRQINNPFYGETTTRDRFFTYCVFCVLQTIYRDLTKARNMTDYGN